MGLEGKTRYTWGVNSIKSRPHSAATIGEITLEVRGKPQAVDTYDLSRIKARYAEHDDGTGYPGSYHIEGQLSDTHKVSLHVEADGRVQISSQFFEPDPELGGVSGAYPTRVDPIRLLTPDEVKSLAAGLQGMDKVSEEFGIVLDRIGGQRSAERKAPDGVAAQHLKPSDGQPLSNASGIRGSGFEVVEK